MRSTRASCVLIGVGKPGSFGANRKRGFPILLELSEIIRAHRTKPAIAALLERGVSGIEQGVYAIWIHVLQVVLLAVGRCGFDFTCCAADCRLWKAETSLSAASIAAACQSSCAVGTLDRQGANGSRHKRCLPDGDLEAAGEPAVGGTDLG